MDKLLDKATKQETNKTNRNNKKAPYKDTNSVPIAIFNSTKKDWESVYSHESTTNIEAFSVLTYNVLFDIFDPEYKYSKERWHEQFLEFERLSPSVLVLQEVRLNYLALLMENKFIRQNYIIVTDKKKYFANYSTILVVKKTISIENSFSYFYQTYGAETTHAMCAKLKFNNISFVVIGVHLRPYAENESMRQFQLKELHDLLQNVINPNSWLICGDFNFECKTEFIDNEYFEDCWVKLRPKESGITFDAVKNHLIYWKGIIRSNTRNRLDRMILKKGSPLLPTQIDIVINKSLADVDAKYTKSIEKASKIYLSDHFGLLLKFAVENNIK